MKQIKTLISMGAVAVACAFGAQCLAQPGAPNAGAPNAGAPNQDATPPPMVPFNLSFMGGAPADLIRAIEDASHQHVNAIIPEEYAHIQLPPLKMQNVTVSELFTALQLASRKTVRYVSGTYVSPTGQTSEQYGQKITSFGFMPSQGNQNVWYFTADQVETPQNVVRFYQLSRELDKFKIEDITTAIKTGWDMLHLKSRPSLKFHPETKMLIAVGPPDDLKVIDQVLAQLDQALPNEPKQETDAAVGAPGQKSLTPPTVKKVGEPAGK